MAQEECLCRSSNLYPCLFAPCAQAEYYQFNRNRSDHLFTDRVVYTPDVVVFKDDQPVPQLLPREQWFRVDVLTCAAPYLGEPVKCCKRSFINTVFLKSFLPLKVMEGPTIIIICFPRCLGRSRMKTILLGVGND